MKKWLSIVSAFLVLSLSSNVSAVAAENPATTTNIASYGADYLIKTDGSFWVWGGNRSVPTQIHDLNDVQSSLNSQYVIKKDLSVWQWRTTAYAQTVQVTPVQELDNLMDTFSVVNRTVAALKGDGTILTATFSSDGLTTTDFTPISGIDNVAAIDGYYESGLHKGWTRFILLKKDGTVSTTYDDFESFETIQNLTDIIQIKNNLALKKDGSVWSWPVLDYYKNPEAPINLSATPFNGISNIQP